MKVCISYNAYCVEFHVVCGARNVRNKRTALLFTTHTDFILDMTLRNTYCDVTTASSYFMCETSDLFHRENPVIQYELRRV